MDKYNKQSRMTRKKFKYIQKEVEMQNRKGGREGERIQPNYTIKTTIKSLQHPK